MDWTDGYVADTAYTNHYFAELAPAHLDFIAISAGVVPPDRTDGRFRYCELGCGNGLSTLILAAANPDAKFVGIDFMPVHVSTAREMTRHAGLKNVDFHEVSFADALDLAFEPFDYVVLHGVYSWISPDVRAEVVAFLKRYLAPGGLVYISYNTLPGWTPVAPVQKLVTEFAATLRGSSTTRVRAGFDFVKTLLDKGAHALEGQPQAKRQIERADKLPANYLAQEFLNEHWHPMYVTDVMRELSAAKLEYVGSASAVENDLRIIVTDDTAKFIQDQPTEELRQLVKDMVLNTRFRRDIYAKGARRLSGLDQRQYFSRCRLALVRSAQNVKYAAEYGGRSVTFDTPMARKVVELLSKGPCTIAALAKELETQGVRDSIKVAMDVALVLVISDAAIPVSTKQADVKRVNAAIASHALEDGAGNALVTAWGTGLIVEPLELAMVSVMAGAKSIDQIAERLQNLALRKGRGFSKAGEPVAPGEAMHAFLRERVETFAQNRQPAFDALGVHANPPAA